MSGVARGFFVRDGATCPFPRTSRQSAGDGELRINLESPGVAPIFDDGHKACTAMRVRLWKGYWSG